MPEIDQTQKYGYVGGKEVKIGYEGGTQVNIDPNTGAKYDPVSKATEDPLAKTTKTYGTVTTDSLNLQNQPGNYVGKDGNIYSSSGQILGKAPTSALPALSQEKTVIQPGADNKQVVDTSQSKVKDLKTITDGHTDQLSTAVTDYSSRQGDYTKTPEGSALLQDVKDKTANINVLSSDEKQQVSSAGQAAAEGFDPMIQDAIEKGRQGKSSDLVAAAKAGGLDSSAWVGVSALLGVGITGAKDFEAVGGALQKLASSYDQVVYSLKAQQHAAMVSAQNAERQAIQTNKAADWTRAEKLFTDAKSAYDDATSMMSNKIQVLTSYANFLTTNAETSSKQLTQQIQNGVQLSSYSDQDKANWEAKLRLPSGSFDQYYSTQQSATKLKTESDKVDYAKKIVDLQTSLPVGVSTTITMPDGTKVEYKSLSDPAKDTQVFFESVGGMRTLVQYNKTTHQMVMTPLGLDDATITKAQQMVTQGFAPDFQSAIKMLTDSLSGGTGLPPGKTDATKVITDPSNKNVYDFSAAGPSGIYATDPNWGKGVTSTMQDIGKLSTPQDITNYIKKTAPNSPVTADMITKASEKFGVSWEMLAAVLKQESAFGTQGAAVATFNPGNVGNTGTETQNMGNWQTGVDAAARKIAASKQKVQPASQQQPTVVSALHPDPSTANVVDQKTGMTPNAIWQGGIEFALTRTMPAFGLGSNFQVRQARTAITNQSAALAEAAGTTTAELQQSYAAASGALKKQVDFLNNVDRATRTADQTGKQLLKMFEDKGMNAFDSTYANTKLNELAKNFGDSGDLRAYQAGLQEVANDYSIVFSRGGQRNEKADTRAQEILSGNITLGDVQKTLDTLQKEGQTNVSEAQKQVDSLDVSGNLSRFYKVIYGGSGSDGAKGGESTQQGDSGTIQVISPDGTEGSIPANQLQDAISQGYRKK